MLSDHLEAARRQMVYGGVEQEIREARVSARFQAIGLNMDSSEDGISAYYDMISCLSPYLELNRVSGQDESPKPSGVSDELLEFARKFREAVNPDTEK